jgi:hypothetical protein
MKKSKTARAVKKTTFRYAAVKKQNPLKDIQLFRWLKKSFLGKSRKQSVDLLDQWILKKKPMTLFF